MQLVLVQHPLAHEVASHVAPTTTAVHTPLLHIGVSPAHATQLTPLSPQCGASSLVTQLVPAQQPLAQFFASHDAPTAFVTHAWFLHDASAVQSLS